MKCLFWFDKYCGSQVRSIHISCPKQTLGTFNVSFENIPKHKQKLYRLQTERMLIITEIFQKHKFLQVPYFPWETEWCLHRRQNEGEDDMKVSRSSCDIILYLVVLAECWSYTSICSSKSSPESLLVLCLFYQNIINQCITRITILCTSLKYPVLLLSCSPRQLVLDSWLLNVPSDLSRGNCLLNGGKMEV